jgi:hypothetical protein
MKLPFALLLAAGTILLAVALLPSSVSAQQPRAYCPPGQSTRPSWVFDQSYYSHDPVHDVRIGGRYSAGGPLYSRPQGFYFSGGNRQVRSRIQIGGVTYDQLNLYESWGQQGSQF